MAGAELVEAGGGGAEIAEAFEELGGFGCIQKNSAAAFEVLARGGERVGGDVVAFSGVGHRAGGAFGVDMLEEKLGEKIGQVQPVELRAETEKARGDVAETRFAADFPASGEREAFVDEIARFVGEGVGGFAPSRGGVKQAADGFAAGATGFQADVREERIVRLGGGGDRHGFTSSGGGGLVVVEREQRVGLVHPGGGEVEAEGAILIERERAQDGDGFALRADGFGDVRGIGLEKEGVAAIHPGGAEGVADIGALLERERAEKRDGFVVAVDGGGESDGRILPLERVGAIHRHDRQLMADLGVREGQGAEERERLFVAANRGGERFGGGLGFESLAIAEKLRGLRKGVGGRHRRFHKDAEWESALQESAPICAKAPARAKT